MKKITKRQGATDSAWERQRSFSDAAFHWVWKSEEQVDRWGRAAGDIPGRRKAVSRKARVGKETKIRLTPASLEIHSAPWQQGFTSRL